MDICEACGLPLADSDRAAANPRMHTYGVCLFKLRAEVEALRKVLNEAYEYALVGENDLAACVLFNGKAALAAGVRGPAAG